ncbi:MAG: hypothetical protein MJK15_00710 [Colwellia sp.]|nr:hypothetical protein [Colwellia sp.]
MAHYFIYLIVAYFGIITVFGNSNTRIHSSILCVSGILSIAFAKEAATSLTIAEYVYRVNISMIWDGLTAVLLTIFLVFDKTAWKQALLLCLAVFSHMMIVQDLTGQQTSFSHFFYDYYGVLIISVGLLQLAASYDGISDAISNVQDTYHRHTFYRLHSDKGRTE